MSISPTRQLFVASVAAAFCLGGSAQAQNSPAAQRVLDRARAASGASGWNLLRGLHEVGVKGGEPYERWTDPLRYGDRTETMTAAGKHVQGYNGAAEWRILANGVITGSVDPAVVGRVRSDAFFGAYGYFYPSRFDLRSVHLGVRQSQGRSFDVLKIQPAGGKPRDLWFDRSTGLLGLVIDDAGGASVTVELSDYRRIGPVLVPFKAKSYGGDLTIPQERIVERVDFIPADRSKFSLAPPPKP
ncbi:hypothetical protein [Phenylobacterium sp.]|uniref:hypothetical protein n=1 Tax=Phenylobacterium sp. TaxID=1871053 RepID=UPI00272FEAA6|nr:hypothetical protein [Phenylobacterium sp.]MDP1600375.1 hypothetical protein [Phenylobacterium sp.]MDP3594990.1 hypothetical protein [Phenylobacterium sp.]